MTTRLRLCISILLVLAVSAALPVYAQNFPPKGDDTASSFGQFWILIDPPYQAMFAGCPAYNAATHVLQSPLLYDSATTVIGRSAPIKEGSPQDNAGVPVGSANTMVKDGGLVVPSTFGPIAPGSNEVHTELRHLNMATWPPVPPANQARVRAGVCYNSPACSAPPPANRISAGEVVSNHSPAGSPPDFPARSYFNVYAQIDIPACGGFPGATVFNKNPLLVETASISSFPPSGVVYEHDTSSAVGVKFVGSGAKWKKEERLGCVILAGHGIVPAFPRRAALEEAPAGVQQVAFQKEQEKEKVVQREENEARMRPPQREDIEREGARFQEHMKGKYEREGGRHKDCGPKDEGNDEGKGKGKYK
jgi:hypothetical protein